MTTRRDHYRPLIAAVLQQHPHNTKERRKALREAYPSGERGHWPYRVWCDEIARQTGKKPPLGIKRDKPVPGHLSLFEEEQKS